MSVLLLLFLLKNPHIIAKSTRTKLTESHDFLTSCGLKILEVKERNEGMMKKMKANAMTNKRKIRIPVLRKIDDEGWRRRRW